MGGWVGGWVAQAKGNGGIWQKEKAVTRHPKGRRRGLGETSACVCACLLLSCGRVRPSPLPTRESVHERRGWGGLMMGRKQACFVTFVRFSCCLFDGWVSGWVRRHESRLPVGGVGGQRPVWVEDFPPHPGTMCRDRTNAAAAPSLEKEKKASEGLSHPQT